MTSPRLTLVSFPTCPYVQRALIVLKERRAEFDVVYIDLAAKPDWFIALSPLGKVPVLRVAQDDAPEGVVFESVVILEYLEETLPGPRMHPAAALARAAHRGWMEFGNGLQADLYRYVGAADVASLAAAREVLDARLARLESVVVGPLFAGATFSGVDAVFAPAFRQLDLVERETGDRAFRGFARVDAWRQALAARRSVLESAPPDFAARFLGRLRTGGSALLASRRADSGHRGTARDMDTSYDGNVPS